MFKTIFSALEQLGLTAQKRAIHIQFSNPALANQVFLQRIEGTHSLNGGITAALICLSTNATIPLKQFIGCQVAVDTVTDIGTLFRTTGIVTEAVQGQSDGSLTLYKLKLQDATALWHKRRNSRVFMNKTVIEVLEVVFKEWQQQNPLFASSLSLDLSGLTQDYDVRPFTMQHNQTDAEFLTNLLRSEGVNWLIDEAQLNVANSNSPIQAQKLRLIDDNNQYQALNRRTIRYHRSSATEQFDSMTSLIAERSLQPTAVHIQRWQADALEQEDGAGSVQTKHQHSQQHDVASLGLEDAWCITPAWMQDLNGEDGATASGNNQIEKLNQNLGHYHNAQAKQFIAHTTVRDTQVGYWFKLNEHPEIDQHSGADQEFLIIKKGWFNQNNLPKDLNDQISQLVEQSQWQYSNNSGERQANQLTLQRRNIKTVPEYHPLQHRPAANPQRAKVVGPSGEEIHVDEWGRIKVRFLFTRNDDHQHDGGAGSNDNDTDSVWVDVLTPWAGEGFELRTDQWGAIRAGEGLLITTHAQAQAQGDHLEAQTAKQQLEGNQANAKALSEVAKNQQTDELEALEQLKAFAETIQDKIAKFNEAILLLSSPNGIGLSTPEDIHLSADGQLNQFAGDSINLSTQKNLIAQASQKISLFAAQGGIKQVAAKGKFEIQAQSDGLDILAKAGIQIISTEGSIHFIAKKKIVMVGDSSQLEINGGGIFPTTGGKFECKAGQHLFMGGAQVAMPDIKLNSKPCYLTFEIVDLAGKPAKNVEYIAFRADGSQQVGRTNAAGQTQKFQTESSEQISIHISDKNASKYKLVTKG
ncbi:hypothetical protein F991_02177 [Acinetobacter sp. CIP-A165]|uniref:DUF2345 domain-containing protein n=1 Tax=Acinetobacter sp. CIP-A165 TaxID=40373 RepID=UPI0002CFE5C3|nr:type VI secretion system tip protein VgrG [Acinetobacter sp. CIP-A165]ENU29690.1 hypothetical protein F991_02177 [Acinetobacter sp. CIP-A165]